MHEIKYADAGMDIKKLILCLFGKIWVLIAASLLGAVLGGAIYGMARVVPESEREYQAVSKVYLDFAPDGIALGAGGAVDQKPFKKEV